MKKVYSSIKKGDYERNNESNVSFYIVIGIFVIIGLFEIFS